MIQTEIEEKAVKNFAKFLIDNYKLDKLEFSSTELLDACVEYFNNRVIDENKTFLEVFSKFKKDRLQRIKRFNLASKSLKWVCNQIPENLGDSEEEKMLKAIKLYAESGYHVIKEMVHFIHYYEIEIIFLIDQFMTLGFDSKASGSKIEPENLISLAQKLGVDAFLEVPKND